MVKRRKVVQAHIDAINEIIDELIQSKSPNCWCGNHIEIYGSKFN